MKNLMVFHNFKNYDSAPKKTIQFRPIITKRVKVQRIGFKKKDPIDIESSENSEVSDTNNEQKKIKFMNKKRGRKKLNESKNNDDLDSKTIHGKFSDDNLKRKVKTHFHNYIIAILNSNLKKNHCPENKRFVKIKSKITQNITVEFNQKLFETKIKDIIKDVSSKYQKKEINNECINHVLSHPDNYKEVVKYLNLTYKDMYLNYYLHSTNQTFFGENIDESYEAHKEKLRKKYGDKYVENYVKNAENLINFYKTCQKRKSRKQPNDEKTIPLNEDKKKVLNYNNNYNIEKKFVTQSNIIITKPGKLITDFEIGPKNKISIGTQTNCYNYDSEEEEDEKLSQFSIFHF